MTNDNLPPFSPLGAIKQFYELAGVTQSRETAHKLIIEEANEVIEAAAALLKELSDFEYVVGGAIVQGHHDDLPEEVLQLAARVIPLLEIIPEPIRQEAFIRVHQSNLSKLVEGKPLRDPETGKILKGPNYRPPVLTDLI